MYIVETCVFMLFDGVVYPQDTIEIHGENAKLQSGTIVKGINCIDSFTFTMLPNNPGWGNVYEFNTIVSVWNTNKNRYDFQGRVLCTTPAMDESGRITKEVTCESYFGYLCDSVQKYVAEKNWMVTELLQHIIDTHNSQVEEYKHFTLGEVSEDLDPNDNVYCGIQRDNTWNTIQDKLINKLGGEIRFRVVDGVIYLDYLKQIGETRATAIELSRNMKAIRQENDPSAYITRLIPLGAKLTEEVTNEDGTTETVETEERLTIAEVNDGCEYIDQENGIDWYGIHMGYVEFDDVTTASALYNKGVQWLAENNKTRIKYSITALDLSLLGLDVDDFNVHDYHPIQNSLLGIWDTARIIKKNIDVVEEIKSTIEVGDNFKTLSDIQIEQAEKVDNLSNSVGKIETNVSESLRKKTVEFKSMIQQSTDSIMASVEEMISEIDEEDNEELLQTIRSELSLLSDEMTLKFTQTTTMIENVNDDLQSKYSNITKYFTFDIDGMTIGEVNNPNKVVIDNDEISILVNGVVVQRFDADGKALIPELSITDSLNMFGYVIDQDGSGNVNCEYVG